MFGWEFSYIDSYGDFRGSFSAEEMQDWYKAGYFDDDLQIYIHRGRIADKSTLGELCQRNGKHTPFLFYDAPKAVIHRGFLEHPPGLKVEVKKTSNKASQTAAEKKSTTASQTNSAQSNSKQQETDCAVSDGNQKVAVIHPVTSETTSDDLSLGKNDTEARRQSIGTVNISANEAKKAKLWPLLSPPTKNYGKTMKKTWITEQFRKLDTLIKDANLTELNASQENQDLYGAVCKFCLIRFLTPGDVFKHLTLATHQKMITTKCQIVGTEFEDYVRRLKVTKSRAGTNSDAASQTTSTIKRAPSKAGSVISSSERESVSTTASAGSLTSFAASTNSSTKNGDVTETKKTPKTAALATDTTRTSVIGKETARPSASIVKFMERSAFPSRILTDKEFDDKMAEVRTLAGKVDSKKLITLYSEKMLTNYCETCSVKCQGPTTMLAHFVSRYHCDTVRKNGFKATEDDLLLWKSQIFAAMK
ncbi:unnamed protein product [Cylicocyclus nassatus]|uniref:GYF domain-containing protein n=1 Tax=Cylicocyclus nassatus TaxID=53992 RepID=A0AA36H007_CYLNA|nr:unnamed protein product [Cylicocyclus nassatus]